jgi:hypothetical protein
VASPPAAELLRPDPPRRMKIKPPRDGRTRRDVAAGMAPRRERELRQTG